MSYKPTEQWERQFDEVQQLYLQATIQLEAAMILDGAGLGRSANVYDAAAALGMTVQQVFGARERVLQRVSWQP